MGNERRVTFNLAGLLASESPQRPDGQIYPLNRCQRWSALKQRFDPDGHYTVTKSQVDKLLGK